MNNEKKYQAVVKELKKHAGEERKKTNERFFKTGEGAYGAGDVFLGVRVPDIRQVVKKFKKEIDWEIIKKLLYDKFHEKRLLAVLFLVEKNKEAVKEGDYGKQKEIVRFYLHHRKQINNWDLVDLSAHYILGQAIWNKLQNEKILNKLVKSKIMWDRRMSIVSTWFFIREGKINLTLRFSRILLGDSEDLIHKATGWMLREAWKKDANKVENFLIKNYNQLPRTTLRYSIERMTEQKRKRFLKGEFK